MLLGSYGDDMRDDMWMPRRAGTNRRGVSPAHLDLRGFAPTYPAVHDMANSLLAARSASQVGVHWPRNFVKRTDSLTTRFN